MTLIALRDEYNPQQVRLLVTYGPITVQVMEGVAHARHFWGELGRLLDEIEKEAAAQP